MTIDIFARWNVGGGWLGTTALGQSLPLP